MQLDVLAKSYLEEFTSSFSSKTQVDLRVAVEIKVRSHCVLWIYSDES